MPGFIRAAGQGLDETFRECDDVTTDCSIDGSGRSLVKPASARNLDDVNATVAALCAELGACAAGYWKLDHAGQRLVQLSFVPGERLDPEVGRQFAAATASVPLSQTSLGIVAAVLTGQPAISRVDELTADSGSGRWLRAFGAGRSVAVPWLDAQGAVQGILSVALPIDSPLADEAVIEDIRKNPVQ